MIVSLKNLTQNVVSTDAGVLQPGSTVNVTMSPTQMYLAASGLLSLENLGYVSVTVLEETAANLAGLSPPLTAPTFPAREPQLDATTFQGPVNKMVIVNATATVAAPLQLTAAQSGALVNNGAASAESGFVLPASSPGMEFTFVSTSATGIRVSGSGAETIQIAASTSTATTGHVDGAATGDVLVLVCVAAGKWVAKSTVGTWTVT